MSEPERSDLDADLRLRLSQAMRDQSLSPVVDREQATLIVSEEGPGRTLIMGERAKRRARARDAAAAGIELPEHMGGRQEWVLLPLSDAPGGVIGVGGEGVVYSYVQRELGREVGQDATCRSLVVRRHRESAARGLRHGSP